MYFLSRELFTVSFRSWPHSTFDSRYLSLPTWECIKYGPVHRTSIFPPIWCSPLPDAKAIWSLVNVEKQTIFCEKFSAKFLLRSSRLHLHSERSLFFFRKPSWILSSNNIVIYRTVLCGIHLCCYSQCTQPRSTTTLGVSLIYSSLMYRLAIG